MVPAGEYGVVARKRASGASYGPLSTGDLYDNREGRGPVKVGEGETVSLSFALAEMKEPMFFKMAPEHATATGIRGRILDEAGKPMPGAFAVLYRDADMRRLPDLTQAGVRHRGQGLETVHAV